MRIEAEAAAHRGMTRRTVAFGVTGCARLQTLPRGLPVSKAESAENIVVSGISEPALSDNRRLPVTSLTELRWIVTVAAIRFAGVRRARVPREEIRRMIA